MLRDSLGSFWLWQLLGRLHPLVVHFPIGLLITALFLEVLTLRGRQPALRSGIEWLMRIGAVTAVVAVVQGLLLEAEGDYGGARVDWHQRAGIATAALSLLAVYLLRRARSREGGTLHAYRAALVLSTLSLTVAGHLGASLTHGEEFLTEALPWNRPRAGTGAETRVLLAELTRVGGGGSAAGGSLSETQLDRLNVEVRAILAHRCHQCHSADKSKGGLALDSREAVMRGGESGPALVAGSSAESEIIRRLRLPSDHEDAMPGEGKPSLEEHEIGLIRLWIDTGARWTDREEKTFREAKLALSRPRFPPESDARANPLDRFLGAYLERTDQRWPRPVGDAVFMRRVYLDVVGLLPGPTEMDAFLADPHPDKRARLVDALLARNHDYAQHWLSFWNDLLRNDYSGTGFITNGRRQISPWLYDALLENLPYDLMVIRLLAPDSASDGFIRGIQWRGEVNASQRVEMQAAQNVSQALLGINLKCASCHDSFVSNLSLDQAYSFANVFADSTLEVFRCDVSTGRLAGTGFLFPQLGEIDGSLPREKRLAQLAGLMTHPENGRLYRTVVNRLWARLMGRGLVAPVDEMDNFPWDQDLLDWLAADLVGGGYDLKRTLRTILLSRAYQMPSIGLEDVGEVTAQDFVFRGPLRRRLTAEQFADALSRTLAPVYHAVAFDPHGVETPAQWIWYPAKHDGRNSLPAPGTYYFRHGFELPARKVASAELLVAVDHAFRLSVNGRELSGGDDWTRVQRLDVSEELRRGRNLLAVEGTNEGSIPNPAGLLFSLRVAFVDGGELRVASNGNWKVSSGPPGDDWRRLDYDDSTWEEVREFGSHGSNRYWGRLLDFTHAPQRHPLPFARASLVQNDAFLTALGRPSREIVVTDRDDEATLLQALELTNGEFLNEAVARGANRLLASHGADAAELVREVYRQAFQRLPTRRELRAARESLGRRPTAEEVQDLLWAVVLLPEFQLIY